MVLLAMVWAGLSNASSRRGVPLNSDVLKPHDSITLLDGAVVTFEHASDTSVTLGFQWMNSEKEQFELGGQEVVHEERIFTLVKRSREAITLRVRRVLTGDSQYLASTAIFGFEIVEIGEPPADNKALSTVKATVLITRIFKGSLVPAVGSRLSVELPLWLGPIRDLPSDANRALWLNEVPPAGSRWVAFTTLPSPVDVVPAFAAAVRQLISVSAAAAVESDLAFTERLSQLGRCERQLAGFKQSAGAGVLAAEYFWHTCGNDLLANRALFTALLAQLLQPTTSPTFAKAVWSLVSDELLLHQDLPYYPRSRELEFLAMTFKFVQSLDPDDDFFRNLLETFLPSWLGIDSAMKKVSVNEVISSSAERAALVKFFEAHHVVALAAWATSAAK